jgi:hypothetical protein
MSAFNVAKPRAAQERPAAQEAQAAQNRARDAIYASEATLMASDIDTEARVERLEALKLR